MFLQDCWLVPNIVDPFCGISSGSTLFAEAYLSIVCVEVLRPSQPIGVMSSVVSIPSQTFTCLSKYSKNGTVLICSNMFDYFLNGHASFLFIIMLS